MQERPATTVETLAALSGRGTAALLLALCCVPALAAGTNELCEEAAARALSLDVPVQELAIQIVDHGIANSVAAGKSTAAASDELDSYAPISMVPQAETILREIFDESIPEDHEAAKAAPIKSPNAAPLAELTAPVLREKSQYIIADPEVREGDRDAGESNTSVPGVTDEELLRYRRQMFRTDI